MKADIDRIDLGKLNPSLGSTRLKGDLVAQFLRHDGYVETAKSFAQESEEEASRLKKQPQLQLENPSTQHDIDAVHRQRKFRNTVLR